ncbi:T9SS type A sorting domain-containing protein [Bacteroidota bacterium]
MKIFTRSAYLKLTILFFIASLSLQGQGYYKDIFVDAGVGLSNFIDLPAITFLTLSSEFIMTEERTEQNHVIVNNDNDANGVLLYPDNEPRFRVIYTNGGSSITHGGELGTFGRERIRTFFSNGGSYTGTCAGSAIFSRGRSGNTEEYVYYAIWPAFVQRIPVGPYNVDLTIPADSPLSDYADFGGDNRINDVRYNFGNYANSVYGFPSQTEILLRYDFPGQAFHNQIASWAYKESEVTGRGVVIGCHPEGYQAGERRELMAAILQYAIDGTGAPQYKANLDNNIPVIMDKNWDDGDPARTKIGDRQYHHFRINLDGTAENFTVTLDGENGYDFNLFIREGDYVLFDQYDYSDISPGADKMITLPQDITGEWFIAVELAEEVEASIGTTNYEYVSNLEVLNGIPYSIQVNWDGTATDIVQTNVPAGYELYQNYPNPFNPSTTIRYDVGETSKVKLDIYNIQGQLITTLVDEYKSAGTHHAFWDGRNRYGSKCSSGIYIYQLTTPAQRIQKQMVLVK